MHELGERVAVVHGHELAPERVVRRVEREREPHRLLDLVDEAAQARKPAHRRNRRPAVGDAEVREAPRGREDGVQVEHRLAHAHEDGVVHVVRPPEVECLVEDLRGRQVAAEAHLARRAEGASQRTARLRG